MRNETVDKGKKPFKCNVCDSNFSQKGILKGHVNMLNQFRTWEF